MPVLPEQMCVHTFFVSEVSNIVAVATCIVINGLMSNREEEQVGFPMALPGV